MALSTSKIISNASPNSRPPDLKNQTMASLKSLANIHRNLKKTVGLTQWHILLQRIVNIDTYHKINYCTFLMVSGFHPTPFNSSYSDVLALPLRLSAQWQPLGVVTRQAPCPRCTCAGNCEGCSCNSPRLSTIEHQFTHWKFTPQKWALLRILNG